MSAKGKMMKTMNDETIQMAAEVLGLDVEEVEAHSKEVPEIDGFYIWNPIRGGRSMLVSDDGERLVAGSAVSFKRHLADFLAGMRN